MMEIASKFPWKVGVALAVIAHLCFHYIASLPLIPVAAGDVKSIGQSVGSSLGRQFLVTVATFLQYIVPLAFISGAGVSFFRQRRQSQIHGEVARNPGRNALEKLSWRDFEGLVAETFRRKGYRVVERGGHGPDGGVDLELYMGNDKYLVQCKQWKTTKVGVATVRELYGVMTAERAVGGFVVASGEFTDDAKKFAEGRSIQLVDTQSLVQLVDESHVACISDQARATATEPACPKCASPMVRRTAKKGEMQGSAFWGCSRFPACRGTRPTR